MTSRPLDDDPGDSKDERTVMEHESGQPEAPVLNSGSKPDAKDDLKILPMPELQEKLMTTEESR